jgi:hypothetical protein
MVRAAAVVFFVALLRSQALAPDDLLNGSQRFAETGQPKGFVEVAETDPPPQDVGEELKAWDRIKRSNGVSELEAYVARYKDKFLANLARRRIEQLDSQRAVGPSVATSPPAPLSPSSSAGDLISVRKKSLHTHYSKKTRRGSIAQPRRRETVTCRRYRISAARVRLPPRQRPSPKRTLAKRNAPRRYHSGER